jgi:hypothetical protein
LARKLVHQGQSPLQILVVNATLESFEAQLMSFNRMIVVKNAMLGNTKTNPGLLDAWIVMLVNTKTKMHKPPAKYAPLLLTVQWVSQRAVSVCTRKSLREGVATMVMDGG